MFSAKYRESSIPRLFKHKVHGIIFRLETIDWDSGLYYLVENSSAWPPIRWAGGKDALKLTFIEN